MPPSKRMKNNGGKHKMSIANNEIIIRLVGKLTMEFPDIDRLKVRVIVEEILYKYDIIPQENALVASDIEDRLIIYLACKKLDGLSVETLKNYKGEILRFSRFLIKPIATVTTMDLRMYLAQRCKNLSPGTQNTMMYILRSFFSWLCDEKYIPEDPARRLKATKEPIRLRQPLSEEQMEIFRQACETDREKALTEFLYSSACRLNDAYSLSISQIDWNECTATVIGKGNKERTIYFSIKAKVLLKKYFKTRKGESDALFITEKSPFNRLGKRSIERVISKINIRSGLEVNVFPHKMRHTKASDLANAGAPIQIIQGVLGHNSITSTTIYAKTTKANMLHEFRRFSA